MIAIINYRAGNLTSVQLAFNALDIKAQITNDPAAIERAERIVFPGVGAAATAMKSLRELKLIDVLKSAIGHGIPFLGICLGTQIILERSEENGGVDMLALVPGIVRKFRQSETGVKIPQMGWNNVELIRNHPVFNGIENKSQFYFVHSYYAAPAEPGHILGVTEYASIKFASVISMGNLIATQFHPEKSGRIGLKLLENFSRWTGSC